MATYRVACIGCGVRSEMHLRAYQHIPGVEIVGACDPKEEARRKNAEEFGIRTYAEAGEMIRAEAPDLVHIVTWPDTRVELMTLVSELGVKAATVEKPIATGVADWRALCELEAASATKFAVCHQFRWHADLVRCREALESGALGAVKFLDFSAGMNISGQGTHVLNYGMSLNGNQPVTSVFGAASGAEGMTGGHPGPDTTAGCLTMANGVRALWNNGPTAPKCGDPSTVWQHVRAAAYAERGHVEWQEFGTWRIAAPGGDQCGHFGDGDTWGAGNLRAQAEFHKAMLAWIEDDRAVPGTNLKQSLHEWQVVLALYASSLWRRPVELAEFQPPEDLFDQLAAALA